MDILCTIIHVHAEIRIDHGAYIQIGATHTHTHTRARTHTFPYADYDADGL